MNTEQKTEYIFIIKKTDNLTLLGHLDFLALIEKIVRRLNIPIAFSNKTKQTMKINHIQPLSTGLEGSSELLHITTTKPINTEKTLKDFQKINLDGLDIIKISKTKYNAKWFHRNKYAAIYKIFNLENPESFLRDLNQQNSILNSEIIANKALKITVTNTSQKQVNIKDLLLTLPFKLDIIDIKRSRLLFKI